MNKSSASYSAYDQVAHPDSGAKSMGKPDTATDALGKHHAAQKVRTATPDKGAAKEALAKQIPGTFIQKDSFDGKP